MSKDTLAQVFHLDLQGKREAKYDFLNENSLASIDWNKLEPTAPNFFFVKKNFEGIGVYEMGFKVDKLFSINNIGIATGKDVELINIESKELEEKYSLKPIKYSYRPFDIRYTIFNNKILQRARYHVMKHITKSNLALQITSKNRQLSLGYIFISKYISDRHLLDSAADSMSVFPLYLYSEASAQQTIGQTTERTPNLNADILKQIAEKLGLTFVPEQENGSVYFANNNDELRDDYKQVFAPIDILDYIYAVLHSPTYREKYKEFLKIDFPRVPYPKDASTFWKLVKLGGAIRQIHLLESPVVEKYITQYPEDGDNIVTKPRFVVTSESTLVATEAVVVGNVYINDTQYFANVPEISWNFYIGGYQPAQNGSKTAKKEH